MKCQLLAAAALWTLCANCCAAQTPAAPPADASPKAGELKIPGFLGIKWDSTQEAARKIMAAKGFKVDEKNSDKKDLFFDEGMIAGRVPFFTVLHFCKEGFWEATVYFDKPDDGQTVKYFDTLQTTLTTKYGAPTVKERTFDDPFKEGDGKEPEAIKAGSAHLSTYYFFDDKKDAVFIEVEKNDHVSVTYEYCIREHEIDEEKAKALNNDL